MEQGHSVPHHKVCKETFHGRWEINCFGSIYWGTALHGGLMVRSISNFLEVCFVGLVIEGICVWCLVIVAIFMVWGMLKSHQLGVEMQFTKGRLLS